MASEIRVPKLGMSVTEVTLVEWMVADGERVQIGDVIYVVETDKSTNEIEAQAGGIIHPTGDEGTIYQVGDLIGTIE